MTQKNVDSSLSDMPEPSLFQLLALSLANAALIGLGSCADPTKTVPEGGIDLTMAKQNIDLLEMLEQKTTGNLSGEERQLLQGLLFDLRVKFVEANKLK